MTNIATGERHEFQTEVRELLDLMIHSLYSHKDIFLRELISNASDACDKLRYLALTQPELAGEDSNYRVVITPDKKEWHPVEQAPPFNGGGGATPSSSAPPIKKPEWA